MVKPLKSITIPWSKMKLNDCKSEGKKEKKEKQNLIQ